MPCWEVNTMSVKLEAANKKLLKAAAEGMGLRVYDYETEALYGPIVVRNGTATFAETKNNVRLFNELKVNYSKQVVQAVAKKKGWAGSWMRNSEKPTVKLRRY